MIDIDTIMALNPCYERADIASLMRRDPYEALCSIPVCDARWLLARLMTTDQRTEWAQACARRAKEYAARTRAAAWAAWAAARAARAAARAEAAWAGEAAAAARSAAPLEEAVREAEHHIAIRHALMLLGVSHNG